MSPTDEPPGDAARGDPAKGASLQPLLGRSLAGLIRFAGRTSHVISEPADVAAALRANEPAIIAIWHGQFMLIPYFSPAGMSVRIAVARHDDAEVLAAALEAFGLGLIRGAGAGHRKRDRGGAQLVRVALTALKQGHMIPMTADVPPGPARRAGLGIVTLARLSGRPIVPVAIASSRYLALDTWSRMTINLPWSRVGICVGEPVSVPRDATPQVMEQCRAAVQDGLDAATRRAYELARAEPLRATPPAIRHRMGGPDLPLPDLRLKAYRAATSALRPLAPLILGQREQRGKEEPERRPERLGQPALPRPEGPLVWLHAASVGETNTVLPVIHGLAARRPDLSFLLTTGTVTSARLAASRLADLSGRCRHQYIPLDAPAYIRRFLEHWRPHLAILIESEIWPNLVLETAARKIPIALVNGRMSRRSYRGWGKRRAMAAALFSRIDLVLAQNAELADWFTALGARHALDIGNLKMDVPAPPIDATARAALAAALGDRPVLLAASTHADEEVQVARVHAALKAEWPALLTIIAPRHPDRGPALADAIAGLGLAVCRRAAGTLPEAGTDVYLADTIGELGTLFSLAPPSRPALCLMGGSLVPHGGQNPIEAIKHGCAVLTGPHTENFADTYAALLEGHGVRRVGSADEFSGAARALLADRPALVRLQSQARTVVERMSGALERTLDALTPLLPVQASPAGHQSGTPSADVGPAALEPQSPPQPEAIAPPQPAAQSPSQAGAESGATPDLQDAH